MKLSLLSLSAAAVFLAGCQRSVEISGEVFTHRRFAESNQLTYRMIRQAGTVVYLLSEEENSEFLNRLSQRQAAIDRECLQSWLQESNKTVRTILQASNRVAQVRLAYKKAAERNPLVAEYRSKFEDPRTDAEILSDIVPWMQENKPRELAHYPDAVSDFERLKSSESEILREAKIERIDQPIASLLLPPYTSSAFSLKEKALAEFLANCQKIVADSEGKFKVQLNRGQSYYVVAQGGVEDYDTWHFRFIADGQKLILSDGNERTKE